MKPSDFFNSVKYCLDNIEQMYNLIENSVLCSNHNFIKGAVAHKLINYS